jgi:hypothetical protein
LAASFTGPHSPLIFFSGYIKDAVYVPLFVTTLPELVEQIRGGVISVTPDLLSKVCTELEYRYEILPNRISVKLWVQKRVHVTYSTLFII